MEQYSHLEAKANSRENVLISALLFVIFEIPQSKVIMLLIMETKANSIILITNTQAKSVMLERHDRLDYTSVSQYGFCYYRYHHLLGYYGMIASLHKY